MPEEEVQEQENQENEDSADEKKGKSPLVKIILIPVIVAIQAAVAYFLVFNYFVEDPEAEAKAEKQDEKKVGQFYELKDVVVNPAGSAGRRFLVVEMGLETSEPKVIEEAGTKEIWIRDAVLSLLVEKSPEELLDIGKRETIKNEILASLNGYMSEGKFDRIYFTKYIMQ